MVLNIGLLHRTVDVTPLVAVDRQPLAHPSLSCIPPRRQQPGPGLGEIQEFPELGDWVFLRVEADVVSAKAVFVFHSHAEAIDELGEGLLFREGV